LFYDYSHTTWGKGNATDLDNFPALLVFLTI
jgi:hypothetical protein